MRLSFMGTGVCPELVCHRFPMVADSVASHTLTRGIQKHAKRVGGDAVGDPGAGCLDNQQMDHALHGYSFVIYPFNFALFPFELLYATRTQSASGRASRL